MYVRASGATLRGRDISCLSCGFVQLMFSCLIFRNVLKVCFPCFSCDLSMCYPCPRVPFGLVVLVMCFSVLFGHWFIVWLFTGLLCLVIRPVLRSALTKRCKTFIKRKQWCVEHILMTQELQLWQLRRPIFVFFLKNFQSLLKSV